MPSKKFTKFFIFEEFLDLIFLTKKKIFTVFILKIAE